ncbi:CABL1 enzyme, partial [Polypterus senegalus]|nr:CABL1 enzyme [Polypterus senegalus]
MAAAASSSPSATTLQLKHPGLEPTRKRIDPRRRQAALTFLTNISLDGRPVHEDSETAEGSVEVRTRGSVFSADRGVSSPTAASIQPLYAASHPSLFGSRPIFTASMSPLAKPLPAELEGDVWSSSVHVAGQPPFTSSRGRLQSFTQGILPASFSRATSQSYCCPEQGQVGSGTFELQRSRRRLISQRSSLETLEDIEENAPLRRIVLISGRRSFCSVFSVLPYRNCSQTGDMKVEGGRQRHPSGGVGAKEMVIGLEGVELGADGKTVSYTQFLYPTNALSVRRNTIDSTASFSQFRNTSHRSLNLARANSAQGSIDTGNDIGEFLEYDPNLLDDPQWPCGKHKRVLIFPSYMTTVIEYVKPSDLKKDMNETFKEKFPHIKLTLSKIRSLKREMRKLAQDECGFEEPTVAMSFVYFEKLALKGKLNKQNRKLCAGACVLLAAKIGSDLKKHEVKHLIDKLEERFRLNRRELIAFEFPVLVALEFALHLPEHETMPHYRRLLQNS